MGGGGNKRERKRMCVCVHACVGQTYIVSSESAGDNYYGAQIYLEKPSASSHVTGKKKSAEHTCA